MKLRISSFAIILLILSSCSSKPPKQASNLPRSHEAVFLESSSPSEVMIRATGIGIYPSDTPPRKRNKKLDKSANLDAERAAIWYLLYGGSDPLLQTEEEKEKFKSITESFFDSQNVRKYITWSANEYETRLKIRGGKQLKIEKVVKVNKRLIEEELTAKGIIISRQDLLSSMGMPVIMVIPEAKPEKSPLEILQSEPNYKKCAEVIESYLTARKYEAIAPEQASQLSNLSFAESQAADAIEDFNYLMALSIGSDVYITFSIQINERRVGTSRVKKASVGVRAYESTTGRLLGTETGYSEERLAAVPVLIEEATNDAIDRVLTRIMGYWKEDIKNGLQYKIVISLDSSLPDNMREEASLIFSDVFRQVTNQYKELITTGLNLEYLIWADPEMYRNSSDLYRDIKRIYADFGGQGELSRLSMNRKLLHLKLQSEKVEY